MIQEEYCTFDTCKLLKEAGFPQTKKLFEGNGEIKKRMAELMPETAKKDFCTTECHYKADGTIGVRKSQFNPNTDYAMPSQAIAMRWLREEHHINIRVNWHSKRHNWFFDMLDINNIYDYFVSEDYLPTYESAAEAGIQAACKYMVDNERQ